MYSKKAVVTEDRSYKPSSPEMPEKMYVIETDEYRWEAFVTRYVLRETGTTVYHALIEGEHSTYGLTANEAVNELATIMAGKSGLYRREIRSITLSTVGSCLDPRDTEREYAKAAESRTHLLFIKKLFGIV